LANRVRVPPPHLDLGFSPDCLVCNGPCFFKPEPTDREPFVETISQGPPLVNVAA